MARRRKLFAAAAHATGDPARPYDVVCSLGLGDITADDAQSVAAYVAASLNDQLDYAGSKYRLVLVDRATGKPARVSIARKETADA